MNIAFDAGAIELAKGSGVGNYTLNQFKSMIELYPEDNYFYFNIIEESGLTDIIACQNFKKEYIYPGKNAFLRHYNGEYQNIIAAVIKKFIKKNNIDVFYITAPFLTSSDIGFNLLYQKEWFGDTVVVATVYDIIPYIMKKQYLPSKEAYNWYMSCIDMIRWTDRQLVISGSVRDDLIKYLDFDANKMDIIYGGVSGKYHEMKIDHETKISVYKKFKIDSEFMMVSISADQRKNADGIIAAYALLPISIINKYQLVIVGRLSQENMEKFDALINKLGVQGRVVLAGYVSDEEIVMLYNLAKLMVFPSLYEGFGLPVIEAWACGTPVLASYNSSLGEITGEAGLLFDPYDKQDMARGIIEALTNTDLDKLTLMGKEKVGDFTWDRVAKLSVDSIKKAYREKQLTIPVKSRLACVFLNNKLWSNSWKSLLSSLEDKFVLDLFISHKNMETLKPWSTSIKVISIEDLHRNAKQYDHILYFSANQIDTEGLDLLENFEGSLLVIDKKMEFLVDIVSENLNEKYDNRISMATVAKLGKYFFDDKIETISLEKMYHKCTRIITADSKVKLELVNLGMKKPVYCINPIEESCNDLVDKNNISEITIGNIINSILDVVFWSDGDALIEKIRCNQISENYYSEQEIYELSNTLSIAMNTDMIMNKVNINNAEDLLEGRLRVDMVTSWNSKCGIAEYTKYYVNQVNDKIDFNIFPNLADNIICKDEDGVQERLWKFKEDTKKLYQRLSDSDAKLIHIQYTEGFFVTKHLAEMIEALSKTKKIVVSCHNSKFLIPTNKQELANLNKAHYVLHQIEDFNHLLKSGINESNLHLIPLGQIQIDELDAKEARRFFRIENNHPVIGSYGFLLPHKGIYETIQAISLLKLKYPNILYIAVCALHDAPVSKEYYEECSKLILEKNLENNVRLITDFLEPEESLLLLQNCELFVMPYSKTQESASGAIRFCVAAKRPIIVTEQPIFNEFKDCVYFLKDNAPEKIAKGIKEIFVTGEYEKYSSLVFEHASKSSWESVGEEYVSLYKELLK